MVNFTMLVHNRPAHTTQALNSLAKDWKSPVTYTILDDRSDEFTQAGLVTWATYDKVLVHRIPDDSARWGTGELRNIVIRTSEEKFGRGDYLYLSDNDVFFKPGWLETLIALYECAWQEGYRVVGAYNHPYHQLSPTGIVGIIGRQHSVYQVQALALQSMMMRWEVWDKYGPFCETPVGKVCQGEDVDFTNRIVADGGKIGVVSPALLVNTGITNSFGEKIPGWELVKAQCPAGVLCE